jgi:hypothetical protein
MRPAHITGPFPVSQDAAGRHRGRPAREPAPARRHGRRGHHREHVQGGGDRRLVLPVEQPSSPTTAMAYAQVTGSQATTYKTLGGKVQIGLP